MGLIPDDIIGELRDRADLVAIVGRHVKLKKSGRSFKGLCPFHGEKSPSFYVHPDKNFYYCFGCQAKGDAFSFLMEYEGRSFVDAAQSLAAELGVTIPETARGAPGQTSKRRAMLDLNRAAADFYREQLSAPAGQPARDYLATRGIGSEIAAAFQLGYAPDEWGELDRHLRQLGQIAGSGLQLAEEVGLLVVRKSGRGHYDRFRDRLMCPIIQPSGEVVGFSGRKVKEPAEGDDPERKAAKYINSPESPVYKKSKLLFGLHLARQGFRDKGRAILVEGNFDVIGLHQAGFGETVAPLGTALTPEQVDQLRRLTDEVILFYDGDRAGRVAAYKALLALVEVDLEVKIAVLPEGEDPDSALRQRGPAYVADILESARPALEYFIYDVWAQIDGSSAHRRARALEAAASLIRRIGSPVKRDLVAGKFASAMRLDRGTVERALRHTNTASGEQNSRNQATSGDDGRASAAPTRDGSAAKPAKMPPDLELELIAIVADHPQLIETPKAREVFSHLTDERVRDMYSAALAGEHPLSGLPDRETADPMSAQIHRRIAEKISAGAYEGVEDPAHTLGEAVSRLLQVRERVRLKKLQSLQAQADEAGRRGDLARQRQIVREIVETRRQVD